MDKQDKKHRLLSHAEWKAAGKGDAPTKRPPVLRAGINTVTNLVESKKAQLVIIANDVDPFELIVLLPALYHKWEFYTVLLIEIRLCHLVHIKNTITIAFTLVNLEDKGATAKLITACWTKYNDTYDEICQHWGDNILGPQSTAQITKLAAAKAKELTIKLC
ncbi:60S ribosomal protein L7a-like [Protopterus annectens]|uniref:60S ribosomal protein L7a-like n=1 Tax=Protopterus annectens TaxID=7888 RepID=UPI001CF9F1F2|nr:60S ribosomal protein L7a-like [Protopterus annectens]